MHGGPRSSKHFGRLRGSLIKHRAKRHNSFSVELVFPPFFSVLKTYLLAVFERSRCSPRKQCGDRDDAWDAIGVTWAVLDKNKYRSANAVDADTKRH
jgi:hypothetical protein